MTDAEKTIALAIEYPGVSYVPGTPNKRFSRDIASIARSADPQITEGQALYLLQMAKRYRRQLPADIVALADALIRELENAAPDAATE